MERHGIDEQRAFVLLREQARRSNTKMVDVAALLLASHRLLSGEREPAPSGDQHGARPDERT